MTPWAAFCKVKLNSGLENEDTVHDYGPDNGVFDIHVFDLSI